MQSCLSLLLGLVTLVAEPTSHATCVSPDEGVTIELFTTPTGGLQYQVRLHNRAVIEPSKLRLKLATGETLGAACQIAEVKERTARDVFEQFPGKRRLVNSLAHETTVTLTEAGRTWRLVLRAYNDAAALRYDFPAEFSGGELVLAAEETEFILPAKTHATALPLAGFVNSHEGRYQERCVSEFIHHQLYDVPLQLQVPEGVWAEITEANLTNYAGVYLTRQGERSLVTRLAPRPEEPAVAVRAPLPCVSPWRVILLSDKLERLLESDTVLALNAPRAREDVSWIRPGKTTFPWWNGYSEAALPFQPGLNTATINHYINFCAEYGIEYHSLDGVKDIAWYSGPIVPYEGADITQALPEIDLPAVLAHAQAKGVKLRLWMHWQAAQQHMHRAFPLYREWGIEGVMIDFMDRNDQSMIAFQHELLKLAAANQLTVNFHGAAASHGLERTYPHLLNCEGAMNLEYNKWDAEGIPPEHDLHIAMTRMLGGPLDYHLGSLRGVPLADFKPRNDSPLVIGTPCRMAALYVVLQNALPMLADDPTSYRAHSLTKVLVQIPTTWDETRVLSAQPGEELIIARRNGDEWWIGALAARERREVRVPLAFLPPGISRAELWRDDLTSLERFHSETREVKLSDELRIPLAPAGGALIKLLTPSLAH